MANIGERLAHVEAEVAQLREQHSDLLTELRDASKKLDKLNEEMTRYKGMAGGIMLALSCIFAFFKIALPFLGKH